MAQRLRLTTASDYASLDVEAGDYYYGYEFGHDAEGAEVWGFWFRTAAGKRAFDVAYEKMAQVRGCPSQFDTQGCLLFGIGLWMNA